MNMDNNVEKQQVKEGLGFIGGGQMAEALIKGIIAGKLVTPDSMVVSEPWEQRREYIHNSYGVKTVAQNAEVLKRTNTVILAVKPQAMKVVLADINQKITKNHLVISIAAGVTLFTLEEGLPRGTRVIRVMPNTPALVQAGAAGLCRGQHASRRNMQLALTLFAAVGVAVEVSEHLMDAVTGLSGSGPAYCFTFLEGLIDAGVREGLTRPIAHKLAVQTMLGSAMLCSSTEKHPAELCAMVTSPGGTTIEGLFQLEKSAFRGAIMDAVHAASRKSKELGNR